MRKLCFKRIIAAAMICSLVISYADITPAFAANIDETEEISDSVDDTAEDINKGSEVSENEIIETQSDDKEAGYQEISDNSASDGSQSGVLSIAEIKELPAAERVISLENKVSEEDAVSELPETWSVILQDGTERDVRVAWKCKGDFNDDSYTSFVFQGVIDDESVEPVGDENITQKLSMEIYFENAVKYGDDNMIVSLLSPDTIIPEIDKEQGTGEYTEDFTADYGSEVNAVIGSLVDYSSSKVKLSNSAYNVFKGISPASDNYLYSKLSAGEKRFYNNIDIQVAQYLYYGAKCTSGVGGQPYTAFIPSAGLSTEEMEKVFYVYYYNNPQAFFLTNAISISGSMDQGYSMSIAFLPDAATPSTLKSKAEEIAKNIKSLSATVNKQSKEYDKAKKAQSLLCKRVTIDQDYITTTQWKRWTEGSQKYDQSVMSVFSGKRKASLSGGYSKSFMALARLAGIETFDITSIGGREWNKARLYGEWFNVDTMADDTDDMSGSGCIYDSFMKSDTTVNKDGTHTWAEIWKKLAPKSSRNYTAKTKRYSIKYHLNGGKNNKYNPSAYTVKAGTIKLWSPTRTGYKFKGWYKDDDFDDRIKSIKASSKKSYELYAKWSINTYKITYHLNGGKLSKKNPKTYTVKSKNITLNNPTRTGYNFKGWYTNASFSGSPVKTIKSSSARNYHLYAKFELPKYKITYKLKGGKNSSKNPAYYTTKTSTIKLADPTRKGYAFGGWYSDSGLSKRVRQIKKGSKGNKTLYAKWIKIKYTITYELDGGTNAGNPKTYTVTSSTITLKNPTKTGFVFDGWYTDSKLTKKITAIKQGSTGNLTLYAKWTSEATADNNSTEATEITE